MEADIMSKVTLTNEIFKRILEIDENRFSLSTIEMPPVTKNSLRKNSSSGNMDQLFFENDGVVF